jgi:tRNA (cmo5U34)-methyltransferase
MTGTSTNGFADHFADPAKVAAYAEGPKRFTPGLEALHRMTVILLREHAGSDASLLVLGAGGGLELQAMATAEPEWRFAAVDPSGPMLDLARKTVGTAAGRMIFIEGLIDDAPIGPFGGATCLLTLHFLPPDERRRTLTEIRRRLCPGAPLVVAHGSFPQTERTCWLDRYAAFAIASGAPPELVAMAREKVAAEVHMLDPAEDERLMREAGFDNVTLFYAAFTWRGWVAYA